MQRRNVNPGWRGSKTWRSLAGTTAWQSNSSGGSFPNHDHDCYYFDGDHHHDCYLHHDVNQKVGSGQLMSKEHCRQLAILHPRKLSVYQVNDQRWSRIINDESKSNTTSVLSYKAILGVWYDISAEYDYCIDDNDDDVDVVDVVDAQLSRRQGSGSQGDSYELSLSYQHSLVRFLSSSSSSLHNLYHNLSQHTIINQSFISPLRIF